MTDTSNEAIRSLISLINHNEVYEKLDKIDVEAYAQATKIIHALAAERDALAARLEETECNLKNLQDRIEVKGGGADAPTQWAYEQACAALHRHKERAGVKDQQLHIARESLLNIAKCADDEDSQETAKNALVIMRALEADE